jgi:mannose-6-phosphate isomerase-like protein (cupin superfamily)
LDAGRGTVGFTAAAICDGRRGVGALVAKGSGMSSRAVRRVVTGIGSSGKSEVVSDGLVAPITVRALPGYAWTRICSLDWPVTVPNHGAYPPAPDHFPPPSGVRFSIFTVPPAGRRPDPGLDPRTAQWELEDKLPGRSSYMEQDQAGLHATPSVDFVYVVSGEIWLELDDGQEVYLTAGDTVVQNGVRHAWRNRSGEPCTMAICLVGAARRELR